MSFSYNTNSPTSTTDTIRLLIGDTTETDHLFEDEELQVFNTLGGSAMMGAALACRAIAVDTSKQAMAYRMLSDSVEIDKTKIPKYFIELADKLEFNSGIYSSPIEYLDSSQTSVSWAGVDQSEYVDDDELV